jgi:hypothetical protein
MGLWPREIVDDEAIVRGICSPYHFKNEKSGKLSRNAFWPPPTTDEVSVMRVDWIGANMCKRHAQALENIEQKKFYKGLAVLSAEQIRQSGASVVDSREVFEGHADIRHRIIAPAKGEPFSPPEKQKELYDRCSALADLANYYPDPNPEGAGRSGPQLRYKS